MIVRWSLDELRPTLAEVGIERPFLIASRRWDALDLPPHVGRLSQLPATDPQVPAEADGILVVGGGSAIDTAKHASAESGKPVVHVPTTYSGAEWTTSYGIRSPDRIIRGGGGGAQPVALVYDVALTLDLPPEVTAGTALNGLAHCAEALYVKGRNPEGDEQALAGATRIVHALPQVLAQPHNAQARRELLEGAAHAGHALALAGLGLAHAMAQALGGTYGLPHGAMNALCLPPALEFNAPLAPEAVDRFAEAVGGGDAVQTTRALAANGGFENLRQFGVPEADLARVAEFAAGRGGNQNNPRPATAEEILTLFRGIY
ncbi:MAG TPA: iron-containing alcohol dehydrogenase [Gaiellaceae bacterium]|nr:iron-containing alcohol dehydrogenase [Gaiellaceae bacterium]